MTQITDKSKLAFEAGGFSFHVAADGHDSSRVGARLSSNSREDAKSIAKEYPDLYEIIILNVEPE